MREIEFRGLCPLSNKMKFGSYATSEHSVTGHIIINKCGTGHYPVNGETVGQFTGLYDITATKIFEGDIVSVPGIGIAEVIICPDYGVVYKYVDYCGDECRDPQIDSTVERDLPEVIGNIHQTPELLEQSK